MASTDELFSDSLLEEIAPAATMVAVNGKQIPVIGISGKGLALLVKRFPEIRAMVQGQTFEIEKLLDLGGELIGPIIAAGVGRPGDQKAEKIFGLLTIEPQTDLLIAIKERTLPNGPAPLGQKLSLLLGITSESANA